MADIQVFDKRGRVRLDFTPTELTTIPKERLPLFKALQAASLENDAAEEAKRDATANVGARSRALDAARTTLLKLRPKLTFNDIYRAHLAAQK